MDDQSTKAVEPPVFLVGIAASAGGLEAASLLVQNLPRRANAAYVLAQHMSPTHKSLLTSLISRETSLPVVELSEEQAPTPDTIFVTPPNSDVVLADGKLKLVPPAGHAAMPKPSADRLFDTLANQCGDNAVGIVLSGTGSDGSYGVQAIREGGGITIAQDLASAKYDGMPASAIETGCVDLTLSPEQIGEHLEKILARPRDFDSLRRLNERPSKISDLLQILLARTSTDFRDYKENTINRRINRRMTALNITEYEDYVAFCRASPDEVEALYRDLLISVTRFFRDKQQFIQLKPLFSNLVQDRGAIQLRLWVAGCATGEEAYSIAILLAEALGGIERLAKPRVQIFATDIDDRALEVARRGIYPITAANDIPPEYVEKYFVIHDGRIEVRPEVKSVILFSQHNVIQDPPFMNVDFVSLRNVLIYFNSFLQERVLGRLHYALAENGVLFLGTSEAVSAVDGLFETLPGKDKVYKRMRKAAPRRLSFDHPVPVPSIKRMGGQRGGVTLGPHVTSNSATLFDSLARTVAPQGFLCTRGLDFARVFGNITTFLEVTDDSPLQLSPQSLKAPLRDEVPGLIAIALRKKAVHTGRWHEATDPNFNQLRAVAYPLAGADPSEDYVLISLETRMKSESVDVELTDDEQRAYVRQTELELLSTREALQQTLEELQTTNEELQSVNEEMQSTNEELQATNEELETSNEELQSTNEELITVNEELQVNASELQRVTTELTAVLDVIPYPVLVVDQALIVRHASNAAIPVFELETAPKSGVHISQCRQPEIGTSLAKLCSEVLTLREPKEAMINATETVQRLVLTPYASPSGETNGVVVTLVEDVSRTIETVQLLQRFAGLSHWQLDLQSRSVYWSPEVYRIHGLEPQDGAPSFDKAISFYHEEDQSLVEAAVSHCIETGEPFDFRAKLRRADGQLVVVEGAGGRTVDAHGNPDRLVGLFRDVSNFTHIKLLLEHTEAVYDLMNVGFYSYDIENDLPYWSATLKRMLGFDPKTHVPTVQSAIDMFHPDDRQMVQSLLSKAIATGAGYDYQARMLRHDGAVMQCRGMGRTELSPDGRPTHIFGSFQLLDQEPTDGLKS